LRVLLVFTTVAILLTIFDDFALRGGHGSSCLFGLNLRACVQISLELLRDDQIGQLLAAELVSLTLVEQALHSLLRLSTLDHRTHQVSYVNDGEQADSRDYEAADTEFRATAKGWVTKMEQQAREKQHEQLSTDLDSLAQLVDESVAMRITSTVAIVSSI